MAKSRTELDAELDELAAWVPTMLTETDEASHMDAFARRADPIMDAAGPEDRLYVWGRAQGILVHHCLIPADEVPCED
jgi:hypothetical protein